MIHRLRLAARACWVALVAAALSAEALDNGLARTPPMGFTTWTAVWDQVNQSFMERAFTALALKRQRGAGQASLSSLGYTQVGVDDGWQACGSGWNGSFHTQDGRPLVNLTRFPSMSAMTASATKAGLRVVWYHNNCICSEKPTWTDASMFKAHYEGDVSATVGLGFRGAKFDACGPLMNLTLWAELMNSTGEAMMVENCHWGGERPYVVNESTGDLWCPFNIYRTGADIVPNDWDSFMLNLNSLVEPLSKDPPISRPGCWAYPDSVQSGSFKRLEEDRTNFGAWCITSSPLILGMDVTNRTALDRIWDIVSNPEAIAVNQQWAGHPGRLVQQITHQLPVSYVHAKECDRSKASQRDWAVQGPLGSNGTRFIRSTSTGLCVDAWTNPIRLEPCTANNSQLFRWDMGTGEIRAPFYLNNEGKLNGCFDVSGKYGPNVQLTKCYGQPNDWFDLSVDGVWSDRGSDQTYPPRCMEPEHGLFTDGQLWAKPQPGGAVAVFAFNAGAQEPVSFTINLFKDLGLPAGASYMLRDVWARRDISVIQDTLDITAIAFHDSRFLLLTPQASRSFVGDALYL